MEAVSMTLFKKLKGVTVNLKTFLFSMAALSALFLSAFGSPGTVQPSEKLQVTVVPPTVIVETTPGVIPVTGGDSPTGLWTLVVFGLLGVLAIAFLMALFSRGPTHEHIDKTAPHDHDR